MAQQQQFFTRVIKYPPGTKLVVPVGDFIVDLRDFVSLLTGQSEYEAWWDLGEGKMYHQKGEVDKGNDPSPNDEFGIPGTFQIKIGAGVIATYTLRLLVKVGGDDGASWQRHEWDLRTAIDSSEVRPDNPVTEFIAAVHATLQVPNGRRHVILPLPLVSSDGYYGYGYYTGSPESDDQRVNAFARGLETLARHFQQAYAYGFGRIPVPTEDQDRGVHLHMVAESLPYGTSTELLSDLVSFELRLKEALSNPQQADALAAVRPSLDNIFAFQTSLQDLTPLNLVGGQVIVPGERTIRATDVFAWHQFSIAGVNEQTKLGELPLAAWRRYQGEFDRELPVVDWPTVWRWETTKAIWQAVGAFYGFMQETSTDNPAQFDPNNARVWFSASPTSSTCSLRIYDLSLRTWAQVTLTRSGPNARIELTQMTDLQDGLVADTDNYVAARVCGVANAHPTNNDLVQLFDVAHIERALSGQLFALAPTLDTLPPSLMPLRQTIGTSNEDGLGPDGTLYQVSQGPSAVVVSVSVPPIELPNGKDAWSSLTAHALLATINGQMTEVTGRRRTGM
jgi:hypothetical protein